MLNRHVNYLSEKRKYWLLKACFVFCFSLFLTAFSFAQFTSEIIYYENGNLTYVSDEEGNRIPDFSHAGYKGGGVPLPDVPVQITVDPIPGDNTAHIRNAIRFVENLSPDQNGFRGAVLLKPGIYQISGNLTIQKSGVVLKGSGDGDNPEEDTILKISDRLRGTVLTLGNETMSWTRAISGTETNIITELIPVGARLFEVEDATQYQVGDYIIIRHPSTQKWIDAVDGGGTEGAPAWQAGYHDILYFREITGIRDNIILVGAPLFNHLDKSLAQSFIYKPETENLVNQVGVENLRIIIQTAGPESESHAENGIFFQGVRNGWADHVTLMHFSHTGIGTRISSNITISNSKALEPHSRLTGGRRYNFNAHLFSNNILFTDVSSSDGRRSYISNGTSVASGIVFHNATSLRARGSSEGHQKWTHGLLFDNITFEEPIHYNVLSLHNRGNLGSSHGWSAAHSVAWNVDADGNYIFIQKPPTAQNYGIGNQGNISGRGLFDQPEGYIEGNNLIPDPVSLYQAQLEERLNQGATPDKPINFSVSNETENEINLSWKHLTINGPSEFIIERSEDDSLAFEQVVRVTGDTTFTDLNISEETYIYRIRAYDGNLFSSYTAPLSVTPNFTGEILSDFDLIYPSDQSSLPISDNPGAGLNFSWDELVAERDLEITYTWLFDFPGGDFSEPVMRIDSLSSPEALVPYNDIGKIMRESGLQVGDALHGIWTVKASSKTLKRWSEGIQEVSFVKESEFLPESLTDEDFHIKLVQNYPNPFNPVTTIEYHLGKPGHVQIEIFDIRGTRVAQFDEGSRNRGTYRFQFDAGHLASGIYIYSLKTDQAMESRKMLLVK